MLKHTTSINIQTKQFCGFVVIFVVTGDGTGSFKTVNLEVFKLKKEIIFPYWRASVASETLTGVTQLKIGDVCICLDVRMSFCTLTLAFLC